MRMRNLKSEIEGDVKGRREGGKSEKRKRPTSMKKTST